MPMVQYGNEALTADLLSKQWLNSLQCFRSLHGTIGDIFMISAHFISPRKKQS